MGQVEFKWVLDIRVHNHVGCIEVAKTSCMTLVFAYGNVRLLALVALGNCCCRITRTL